MVFNVYLVTRAAIKQHVSHIVYMMFHSFRFTPPKTKILFYIVKHGPNNTKVVKPMNQKAGKSKRRERTIEVAR